MINFPEFRVFLDCQQLHHVFFLLYWCFEVSMRTCVAVVVAMLVWSSASGECPHIMPIAALSEDSSRSDTSVRCFLRGSSTIETGKSGGIQWTRLTSTAREKVRVAYARAREVCSEDLLWSHVADIDVSDHAFARSVACDFTVNNTNGFSLWWHNYLGMFEGVAESIASLAKRAAETLLNADAAFTEESISLSLTGIAVPKRTFERFGRREVVDVTKETVQIFTYPPFTFANGSSVCNREMVRRVERVQRALYVQAAGLSLSTALLNAWSSSGAPRVFAFQHSAVQARCVPTLTGESEETVALPSWLRRALGVDDVSSTVGLQTEMSREHSDDISVTFECELSRRSLSDPLCIDIVHRPEPNQDSRSGPLTLKVSMHQRNDVWFVYLCCLLASVTVTKRLLLRYPALRLGLCAVLGVVVVLCAILYFALKDLQRTRIGKVGILAVLSAGGWIFVTEGLLTATAAFMMGELQRSAAVQVAVVAVGLVSAVFSHVMLANILAQIVTLVFTTLQCSLVGLLWGVNPNASFLVALAMLLMKILMLLSSWGWIRKAWSPFSVGDELSDEVPDSARVEAPYTRPVAQGISGRNTKERLRQYDAIGSECTRKALEDLARTVRSNHAKYSKLVRDPNGLARFAGVGHEDDANAEDM